ncbi:MAG TPA: hypothetical protein VGC48_06280, partial [Gemmatimonadales bacterium]
GNEMTVAEWTDSANHVVGMLIHREPTEAARGEELSENGDVLLLLNSSGRSKPFTLPALDQRGSWTELVNTTQPAHRSAPQGTVSLGPRSLIVLRYEPV